MIYCWLELQFTSSVTTMSVLLTDGNLVQKQPVLHGDPEQLTRKLKPLLANEPYTMIVKNRDPRYSTCDDIFEHKPERVIVISEWYVVSQLRMDNGESILSYVNRLRGMRQRWDIRDLLIVLLTAALVASMLQLQ